MQNSKLMTTAYYRCTKMVVTKTVIDDNVMRMKSQPQLATRWLWSFASFVFNPFESNLLSFDLERDNLFFSSKFLRNIVEIII